MKRNIRGYNCKEELNNVIMIDKQPRNIYLNLKEIRYYLWPYGKKVFKYGISKNKFYDYGCKTYSFASSVRDSLIDKTGWNNNKPNDPEV